MSGFGDALRARMGEAGVGLRELARRAHYDPGHLSKVVNGRERASADLARRLDDALGAEGNLARLVSPRDPFDGQERLLHAVRNPRRVDRDVVSYFASTLEAHRAASARLRADELVEVMATQAAGIERLAREAKPPVRAELLAVGAQYAQFVGRMHFEVGKLKQARAWSGTALEWALAAGDREQAGYVLARGSSYAAAAGDPHRVVDSAYAARTQFGAMPANITALSLRHEAQGHALAGESRTCLNLLDEASETLAEADRGHPYFGTFSEGFMRVQRAGCLVDLNRPREAIDLYERELGHFGSATLMKPFSVARLARAYTQAGEPGAAADRAGQALRLAHAAGSERALQEVRDVHARLVTHWPGIPAVAKLGERLHTVG